MTEELTPRQAEVLRALCRFLREHGYPPSVRELGEVLDIRSTRTVHDHLATLEAKGYLRRHRDRSRALEILVDVMGEEEGPVRFDRGRHDAAGAESGVILPIVGDVAAGQPILAHEEYGERLVVDPSMVRDPRTYLLRVRGDSMIEAHICDGDLILIRPQSEAENGEAVVVLIGDEVTLKRFFRRDGFVELKPENSRMASILLTPEMGDVRILGKLMGVVRTYR